MSISTQLISPKSLVTAFIWFYNHYAINLLNPATFTLAQSDMNSQGKHIIQYPLVLLWRSVQIKEMKMSLQKIIQFFKCNASGYSTTLITPFSQ